MKKIVALVAATVLSASAVVSSVFAENTLHMGAGFPISPLKVDYDGDKEDFSSTGVDFAFDYTHVAEGGFAWKVGFDIGGANTSDIGDVNGNDASAFDFAFGFGFGGSPIHNERMTLSILGDFGIRVQNYDIGSYSALGNSVAIDWVNFLFYIGPEISYTFRFNSHIGLFANFGIFYNIGAGGFSYEATGNQAFVKLVEENFPDEVYTVSGFTFQPKLGLAVTF